MPDPLPDAAIKEALAELPGWEHKRGKLTKSFTFASFKEALSFLVRIGLEAESQDHHPDIHNVYNRVTLTLSTHDADDKVTEKDVRLARTIEWVNWLPRQ